MCINCFSNYLRNSQSFSKRGFGGVEWIEDKDWVEEWKKDVLMYAGVGKTEGVIGIADITFRRIGNSNPMRHLLSALRKIKEGQPLEFQEEISIQVLTHELLHTRVKRKTKTFNYVYNRHRRNTYRIYRKTCL